MNAETVLDLSEEINMVHSVANGEGDDESGVVCPYASLRLGTDFVCQGKEGSASIGVLAKVLVEGGRGVGIGEVRDLEGVPLCGLKVHPVGGLARSLVWC